jgi:hypothetical protein
MATVATRGRILATWPRPLPSLLENGFSTGARLHRWKAAVAERAQIAAAAAAQDTCASARCRCASRIDRVLFVADANG